MEDPNLAEAPSAAQCPSSQSANQFLVAPYLQRASNELKDSSGRPHSDQRIAEATLLGTPVCASEGHAESPRSVPFLFPAFRMTG
ncbi:uncharacterized protein BKA55DRAFT_670734, partial [Fusarium redolens]